MKTEYFLGANSSRGFYSLYSGFCSGEGDYLHIIKGGPGTGKSGFMRRIGKAAEQRGYDVEYVLCSGDPDSLDGVYIPALHRGWVDGTAPHVTEPRCFGFDSDYVNLGEFCKTPLPAADKNKAAEINRRYKACYSSAYDYLKATALLRKNRQEAQLKPEHLEKIRRLIQNILDGQTQRQKQNATFVPRFMHAICCKGDIYLSRDIYDLCKQYYVISSDISVVSTVLRIAAELSAAYVSKLIVCPDPLEPELFEAVLLPELELGFVSRSYAADGARELLRNEFFPVIKNTGSHETEDRIRSMALDKLKQAKTLHDQLESFYKPAMDFAALDEFTGEYIKNLFI